MPRPVDRPGFQPPPPPIRFFESPPGSQQNDGSMPTAYNSKWQVFTNLTKEQIAWFQAQPEWAAFVATQSK